MRLSGLCVFKNFKKSNNTFSGRHLLHSCEQKSEIDVNKVLQFLMHIHTFDVQNIKRERIWTEVLNPLTEKSDTCSTSIHSKL